MPPPRVSLDTSLWIRSDRSDRTQRNARSEAETLRARGAKIFMFKGVEDPANLEELRKTLTQSDIHVILVRLTPKELGVIQPLLAERRNFSIVAEDWWIIPNWFLRSAEYILFRNYNGIAVRTGLCPLVAVAEPPFWLPLPLPVSAYGTFAAASRPLAVLASPFVNAWRGGRRQADPSTPARYIYFPFPINGADVPLQDEKIIYDFANTGGTCGVWIMRDPYSSFGHTFGNLYCDRKRLVQLIERYEGNPFTFYDWQRDNRFLPYDEYIQKSRQTRYLISTGGLHNNSVPKFLEYACLGVPMLGKRLPYEYPWLDDCMFDIDSMHVTPEQAKGLLSEAVAQYPRIRENCLHWRDRLLAQYNFNRVLEMAQAQINGEPIAPGYLKTGMIPATQRA